MLKPVLRAAANAVLAAPGLHGAARALGRRGLLPERLWSGYPLDGIVTLEAAGVTIRYRVSPGDYVGMPLYWQGARGYEPETFARLGDLVDGASCVYDIGANTGLYSLVAARRWPRLAVVAVEPNPQSFARLADNITLNGLGGRVTAVPAAISAREGPVTLHVPPGTNALSATLAADGAADALPGHRPVVVTGLTMAVLAARHAPPDAIKIDAEGHEAAILEGMAGLLAARRPRLLVEVLDDAPLARLTAALAPFGYRFARLGKGDPAFHDAFGPRAPGEGRNVLCRCP